jgi:hypothetical protein
MPSWISRASESHNAQLVATAAVSGFVVGTAILGYQKARRTTRVADLKASIPDLSDDHRPSRASAIIAPADLVMTALYLGLQNPSDSL